MLIRERLLVLCTLLIFILLGCGQTDSGNTNEEQQPATETITVANVTDERLMNADNEPSQWMTYGGNYEEQRYSRLDQINRENVKDLGLAWYADYDSNLSQYSTPLYIDGVIYSSIPWSYVYAHDAKTGELLWKFDPRTPREWSTKVCCGLVNRGIAAWKGKIYVGTFDAKLVAIDAKTGEELWSTRVFDEDKIDDPIYRYSITMPPRVFKGKVVVGASGSEFGVRGFISAYDAESGEQIWRFYTVPGNPADGFENEQMELAAKTWGGEWWKIGGGGTVWDGVVYDTETNHVIFGTGNGTPWNQMHRDPTGGDNLFLASIIAVDLDTGEYAWHYQASPAETWDYDAVSPITLANLKIDGQDRRVAMQPSKNGFFYMLDTGSGELLRAEPFTELNWADGVDMETGRPRVRPEARYENEAYNLLPGVQGAHGWHSNAYNPENGLLYIPTQHAYMVMADDPDYEQRDVGFNLGINMMVGSTYRQENPDAPTGFDSYLQAWDPIETRTVWRTESNGGTTGGAVATAGGLVFQGGGRTEEFRAFDATTGEKLWSTQTQTSVLAAPISYELDGVQYIAVNAGAASRGDYYAPNHSRLLVYKLNGTVELPPVEPYTRRPLDPPPLTASAEVVEQGSDLYATTCALCHGDEGVSRGTAAPNLTRTPMLHSQEAFDSVVLGGVLKERGMNDFSSVLTSEDTQAIRTYIISRANYLKENPPPPFTGFGSSPDEDDNAGEEEEQPHVEQ